MGSGEKPWFSAATLIDKYFLEEVQPYSKKRKVNMKSLLTLALVSLSIFVISVLFFPSRKEKPESTGASFPQTPAGGVSPLNDGVAVGGGTRQAKPGTFGEASTVGSASGVMAGGMSGRSRSSNQVIRRGANGNDPSAQIPMGQGVPARLVNAIHSTNTNSPVVAEITHDVFAHGVVSIPATTRAIGTGRYDEPSHRIQLQFHTLVYPDGDQHPLQGIGMMVDGSAGLEGDYHSGEAKRQFGRFLGHFISGMADGLKDRQAGGPLGMSYAPGSLKNGILTGVTQSAEEESRDISQDLTQTRAYMTLPAGLPFVLYFEREFTP